jgi:Microcystin-dependent protein
MWHGADNDPIFTQGWALCNGQGNTPDLRDRFVVGRGNSYPAGEALGEATKTLGTANLPSHTHTDGTLTGSGGAHSHGITDNGHFHYMFRSGNAGANQNQGASNLTTTNFPKSGTGPSGKYEGYNIWGTGDAPDVGKNATATTGISINESSSFTVDVNGNTGDQGGAMGESFDILPPYYAIAYIMRTS